MALGTSRHLHVGLERTMGLDTSDNRLVPIACTAQSPWVRETDSALLDAFGVRFDLWNRQESWTLVSSKDSPVAAAWSNPEAEPGLLAILDGFLRGGLRPVIHDQAKGHYLLAIPIQRRGLPLCVATARFSTEPQDLIQKLARLFLKELTQRRQLEEDRQDLDAYAAHVSQDLEEFSFLGGLAQALGVFGGSQDIWQVAQEILPLLQRLIQTEALVLMAAQSEVSSSESSIVKVGAPAIWVGPRIINDETCSKMVQTYQDAAAQQAVVKNGLGWTPAAATLPGVRSLILVQLAKADCVTGWLVALNSQNDAGFGSVEASFLSSAAAILAAHGRNIELFREKEALLVNVVRALVSAIDAKDPYTCGHSERVALVGRRLGQQLGLSEEQCERLYLTGLLHDVGKIGVSDRVLQKPGKLTPEEFDEIKRHVEVGYAILADLTQLSYVLPGVRHHHESCDGSGYPGGLRGDGIPFWARILAVADAYDAMSSDRPYRPGMPHDRVEEILRGGAGTQWDPRVVEAFFSALPEIRALCQRHRPHSLNFRGLANTPRAAANIPSPLPGDTKWACRRLAGEENHCARTVAGS